MSRGRIHTYIQSKNRGFSGFFKVDYCDHLCCSSKVIKIPLPIHKWNTLAKVLTFNVIWIVQEDSCPKMLHLLASSNITTNGRCLKKKNTYLHYVIIKNKNHQFACFLGLYIIHAMKLYEVPTLYHEVWSYSYELSWLKNLPLFIRSTTMENFMNKTRINRVKP